MRGSAWNLLLLAVLFVAAWLLALSLQLCYNSSKVGPTRTGMEFVPVPIQRGIVVFLYLDFRNWPFSVAWPQRTGSLCLPSQKLSFELRTTNISQWNYKF